MPDDVADQAVGCLQCGGPLGGSPSDDWCGELCQRRWRASQADALPETLTEAFVMTVQEILQSWWNQLAEAVRRWFDEVFAPAWRSLMASLAEAVRSMNLGLVPALPEGCDDRMAQALRARQTRNTGPRKPNRPPRTIDQC